MSGRIQWQLLPRRLRRQPPHLLQEAAVVEVDVEVVAAVAPPRRPGLPQLAPQRRHLLLPLRLRVMLRLLPLLPLLAVAEVVRAAVEQVAEEMPRLQVEPLRFPVMLRLQAEPQVVGEAAEDGVVEALLLRMHRRQRRKAPLLMRCRRPIP